MTLSQELWNNHQDIAQTCLNHPFVTGIASGTLDLDKFKFYIGQDAFFLEAFARAYSIAAAKAPDWDGFNELYQLAGAGLTERNLHEQLAAEWGVNLQQVQPSAATRRYTDFLLATAWSQETGLTAVAMSPCMRLYAFLGQEIAKQGVKDHQYRSWVETYSSDEFEQFAQTLESLVNRYATATLQTRDTYRYALDCEVAFFSAAMK
ncbi:TenA family protein [Spirulina sp. CS-785/01]|uniref:TenA family protein n=1 Tax=Spirulina sp. CS-785/01 TaxID=3021716 RepID=UPI00232B9086|nr:TenA family protein [Spirulina sp. CS-785/01]MDB9313234.1 TenA family protein [Spirulina sp. CS-785/01]